MSAEVAQEEDDERTVIDESNEGIPEEHRVNMYSTGYYGRPRYKASYYSEKINARAMSTFETRHEAVGYIAKATREGWMKRPKINYERGYDYTPSKHYN